MWVNPPSFDHFVEKIFVFDFDSLVRRNIAENDL